MSFSERYRRVLEQIDQQSDRLYEILPETTAGALRSVDRSAEDWVEAVGEISQFKLEEKISPVLLEAHGHLDRARVLLEQNEHKDAGAMVWELEQMLYRLLNDL